MNELPDSINPKHWLHDIILFFIRPVEIFRSYNRINIRSDLIAGLTVAIVMLPQAIAYALIAELPPEVGLYSAIVAAVVGALWGSSIHLHTGPTNTASLLVLTTLLPIAVPGTPEYIAAAGLLAVVAGVIRLLMGLAHLGVLVNFISDSVIIGFTAGAGILISVNQLRHLLRLTIPSSPNFMDTTIAIFSHLSETHWPSFLLGIITIIFIILIKRFKPTWPATLLGMAISSIVVALLQLDQHGVIVLGELPRSLPPLTIKPLLEIGHLEQISMGALAVAMIGLVEAMSIARSIAAKSGQPLDSNQEFVGQGLANIVAGLFSGYSCSGSFVRSAVNYNAGAKTPLASVFSCIFVLIALLVFAPYAAYLSRTALAGVLIITAYGMVDRQEMKRIWKASLGDSGIMIATLLATLFLPLQFAVLAGIIVSIIRFLVKTSIPQVYPVVPSKDFAGFDRIETQPACPQLGVMVVSGPLYFGAVHHVENAIRANLENNHGQQFLLLRMHFVDHCDVSGIHMLESVVRLYRRNRGDVFLAGVRERLREQMRSSGFDEFLGQDHFWERHEAVSHIFHKILEPSVCIYECEVRVFAECQALPKQLYIAKPTQAGPMPEYDIPLWYPNELKTRLNKEKLILVDVREPYEYKKGHIPQSQSIPLRMVRLKGDNLPTDLPILVICRIGRRSRLAANILKDMGYEQVYSLEGGTLAWEAAGYPLVVGR